MSIWDKRYDELIASVLGKVLTPKDTPSFKIKAQDRISDLENDLISIRSNFSHIIHKLKQKIKSFEDGGGIQLNVNFEDIYTTKAVIETEKTVEGIYRIKEVGGTGRINQILLKSVSDDYNIRIKIDDNEYMYKPFSFFSDNSDYLENISAFLDVGFYYLSIRTLHFQEKFVIELIPTSSMVFSEILLKYTIRGEHYI